MDNLNNFKLICILIMITLLFNTLIFIISRFIGFVFWVKLFIDIGDFTLILLLIILMYLLIKEIRRLK